METRRVAQVVPLHTVPPAKAIGLSTRSNGQPEASASNVATILLRVPEWNAVIEYDERTAEVRFAKRPPLPGHLCASSGPWPRPVADADHVAVQAWVAQAYGVTCGLQTVSDGMAAAAKQVPRDPVREYLGALKWDGVERLSSWLSTYFGVAASEYVSEVGRRWMISAVARTFQPGCQADHVLVLEGSQGIGKSTGLKTLAVQDTWFMDSSLDFKNKDSADALRGPWIVELGELDSFHRAELATIKAFVSRPIDRFRGAYGRTTGNYPRRVVFAGTTNETSYLRDPSGARRFWPVRCTVVDRLALARDRDHLWAEAVVAFKAGEAWWPSEALAVLASSEQEQRYQVDEWETIVSAYVTGRDETTLKDVAKDALDIPAAKLDRVVQLRITAALTRLGWTSTGNPVFRLIDGRRARVRVWTAPRGVETQTDLPRSAEWGAA